MRTVYKRAMYNDAYRQRERRYGCFHGLAAAAKGIIEECVRPASDDCLFIRSHSLVALGLVRPPYSTRYSYCTFGHVSKY